LGAQRGQCRSIPGPSTSPRPPEYASFVLGPPPSGRAPSSVFGFGRVSASTSDQSRATPSICHSRASFPPLGSRQTSGRALSSVFGPPRRLSLGSRYYCHAPRAHPTPQIGSDRFGFGILIRGERQIVRGGPIAPGCRLRSHRAVLDLAWGTQFRSTSYELICRVASSGRPFLFKAWFNSGRPTIPSQLRFPQGPLAILHPVDRFGLNGLGQLLGTQIACPVQFLAAAPIPSVQCQSSSSDLLQLQWQGPALATAA